MADSTVAQTINESTYGGVADSYAIQYGIPTTVFRDLIRTVSGFNDQYSGTNGRGIANLDTHAGNTIDPLNVGDSLNFAANYLSSVYKSTGSWSAAAKTYPGYETQVPPNEQQFDAMGNPTGATTQPVSDSPSLGIMDRITSFFKGSAWTIVFVAVGAILIGASIWVLIKSSGDTK